MKPETVQSILADWVERHRESLTARWEDVPHRVRDPISVPEYDFPTTPDDIFPWVSVCFVVADGRVLLVQDSGHLSVWEPPGGKGEVRRTSKRASGECREQGEARSASKNVSGEYRERGELGESYSETARRETREETGIECEITGLLFTETLQFDYGESVLIPVLQAGFVARRVGGEIRTTEDAIEEAAWLPISDLPDGTQFEAEIGSLAPSR
ncbi:MULTISPECIES: NUDIX domain-containing protein [unclassified Haladaptatus]|uniref:NUDIX hydrolase n=1 Tax=unclassified Haladaptatus TaxID=2622732 RepID=UPI00209C262B|nr:MULTISPECIES: NUDIX domain-containing protein [unclassified Haladaptatus]MCO8246123.1 NUDIX domain-containing protein [Haladaptatus sp. AB643]MCO8254257.1 NUDIX domain-containing protein [Haladaptatus sp. AB618]